MAKQDFILVFPLGICGEKTINVHTTPASVTSVAAQVIKSQGLVFGDLCIIKDNNGNVWAIEYYGDRDKEPKVYTEDDILTQIKATEEK